MKSTAFDMAMMAYRQNDMEGAFRQFLPLAETGDADAIIEQIVSDLAEQIK